ncbi:DOMON-like domain-containing protein [Novosphingobium sp. 1949]|uniref:DOMON-like domain-containing protein n=1 Tax=Novosphingobium organovorum TaxID=2930092 RepID=A0ABT0BA98_9SPHN|nr:DOMON-like domain-containing protein [Novosphingobium organovorum]MCJ2181869.1 DOMON-like domain-containing protein [Novosphingobium organovorum]
MAFAPTAFTLSCHSSSPARRVEAVSGRITPDGDGLRLRWRIDGAQELVVPAFAGKGRADNLWQTTCFELFIGHDGREGYSEFNLSPSERWAAYDFTARRVGMCERPMPHEPTCTMRVGESMAIFDACVPLAGLPEWPWLCGVSAVIEERDGQRSYWALEHFGAAPDFHDPACFTLALAAPQRP